MARERESYAEGQAERERSAPRLAPRAFSTASKLERLQAALETVAALIAKDPVYIPIFERLEREIALEQRHTDALARARAVLHRRERTPSKP